MSVTPLDQVKKMEKNLAEKQAKLDLIEANIAHLIKTLEPLLTFRKRINERKESIKEFAGLLKADDKDGPQIIEIIHKVCEGTPSEEERLKVIEKFSKTTDKGDLLKKLIDELSAYKNKEKMYMEGLGVNIEGRSEEVTGGPDVKKIDRALEQAKNERREMVLGIKKLERELHAAIKDLPPALLVERQLNIIDKKAQERIDKLKKIKERIRALEIDKDNEKGLWIINAKGAEEKLHELRVYLEKEEKSAMDYFDLLNSLKKDLVKKRRAVDSSDKPAKDQGKKKI